MASDSEHDDVEPGSDAYRILSAIKRTPTRPSQAKSQLFSPQPGSLEAELASEGLNAPLSTLEHEEALRDQASKAVEHRQLEIEAYHAALHDALGELQRVRAAEEARLAGRVASSRQRFESRLEELQRSFADEVERLKRQAVAELHKQRHHSEAAIAARVRDLQGQLMFLPHHPNPHLTHNYQQQQQQHRRGVGTPSRSPGAAVSYRHTGSPMHTGGRAGSAGGALRPGTAGSSWGLGSWGSGVGAGGEQHGVGASALLRRQQRSPVRVLWRGEDARPGEREAGGGRKGGVTGDTDEELAGGPCGVPWPRRCRLLGVMHGDGRDCTARTAGGALSGSLCHVGGGHGGGMKRAEPGKAVQQDRTKAAALPTRGGGREARQGAGAGLRRGGGGGGRQAAGLGSLRQCEHGHNNG